MLPAFAIRVTDALYATHPAIRTHDGRDLILP
jgi:hypothetical protein